jgi:hypothetical protein
MPEVGEGADQPEPPAVVRHREAGVGVVARLGTEQVEGQVGAAAGQVGELRRVVDGPVEVREHHPGRIGAGLLGTIEGPARRRRVSSRVHDEQLAGRGLSAGRGHQHLMLAVHRRPAEADLADHARLHAGRPVPAAGSLLAVPHDGLGKLPGTLLVHGIDVVLVVVEPGTHDHVDAARPGDLGKPGGVAGKADRRHLDEGPAAGVREMAKLVGGLGHRVEDEAVRVVVVSPRQVVVVQRQRDGAVARLLLGGRAGIDQQVLVHERGPEVGRGDRSEHGVDVVRPRSVPGLAVPENIAGGRPPACPHRPVPMLEWLSPATSSGTGTRSTGRRSSARRPLSAAVTGRR